MSTSFYLPSLLRSAALAVSLLTSSVLPRSLDVAALFALSIVVSCQKLTHTHPAWGEITWCTCGLYTRARAGVQRVIYVRGHNNCIPMRYRTNIVALAQIQPPRCTISCLASCSAIIHDANSRPTLQPSLLIFWIIFSRQLSTSEAAPKKFHTVAKNSPRKSRVSWTPL